MRHDFKVEYLVCLELSGNTNYVVGKSPTMEGARVIGRKAREVFPGDKVYLTKQMVLREDLSSAKILRLGSQDRKVAARNPETNACKCGKKAGQCVGTLACQCNPVSLCKKTNEWNNNPVEEDTMVVASSGDDEEIEEESDEDEYESNPDELIEEEEFEEDYQNNPDSDFDEEDELEDDALEFEDDDSEDDEEDDDIDDDEDEDEDGDEEDNDD